MKENDNIHLNLLACSYCRILIFFSFFFCHDSTAQQAVNTSGYWLSYMGDNKINDKIGIHSEAQLRNLFFVNNAMESSFVRVGLNFYTSKTSMLTAGYGFFKNSPSENDLSLSSSHENRIWQQFVMRKRLPFVFMEHRYRLEQRFITNTTNNTDLTDHRIRYRFQAIFPFYTISPYLRHFFFASYNEVMLNFRSNHSEIYDRNRLYFALGYQVSPKLNFQIGYLNQLAQQNMFINLETNHLFQIAISYNMDDLMRTFLLAK
jgi:hypothetical protein